MKLRKKVEYVEWEVMDLDIFDRQKKSKSFEVVEVILQMV